MKYLLYIFLIVLSLDQLYAQKEFPTDFKVEYEVTYQIDSLHPDDSQTEKMYLFTGSDYGVFVNKSRAEAEEKLKEFQQKYGANVQIKFGVNNLSSTDLNKAVFKDFKNQEVKVLQELSDKEYVYPETAAVNNWEIGDETKEIAGYMAQKATIHFAGRDYEAWFTMEVPIQDGPYVFYGLPGLVVELYDTQDHYHFTLKTVEKLAEPKVWTLPKTKEKTKQEMAKMQSKLAENALLSSDYHYMMGKVPGIMGTTTTTNGKTDFDLKDRSGKKVTKEDLKRSFKAELERRNNPLELD